MLTLKLTRNQAKVISQACELLARLNRGQVEEIRCLDIKSRQPFVATEHLLKAIKLILFPELAANAYYSITSPEIPEGARIAYDIHQVIRHFLAGPPPEGSILSICYDEPRNTGKEPLPEIEEE